MDKKYTTGFDVICCKCGTKIHLNSSKEGNDYEGEGIKDQACTTFECKCGEYTEQY